MIHVVALLLGVSCIIRGEKTSYGVVKQDFYQLTICKITFEVSAMHECNATDHGRKWGLGR